MTSGNPYPDDNRDRLKNTNNMWSYPEHLGPGAIKAHIPAPPENAEESKDDQAEVEASKLASAAKKTAAAAKSASAEVKKEDAKAASLAQKREVNSTPEKL